LQRMLTRRSEELTERVLNKTGTLKKVSAIIEKGTKRVKDWPAQSDRWNPIGRGLEKTYQQGRSGLRSSRHHSTDEELHEWRKSVKYLRYQLEMLSPLCVNIMDDLAKRAHKLADLLGDDHDLVVLRELISRELSGKAHQALRHRLQQLIRKRRRELQQEAIDLGSILYAEQPKIFRWRIEKYWDAWRK
jgi:CHAD domain-containing protein